MSGALLFGTPVAAHLPSRCTSGTLGSETYVRRLDAHAGSEFQAVTGFLCGLGESKTHAPQNINTFTMVPPMNSRRGSVIRTSAPIAKLKSKKAAPGRNDPKAASRNTYPASRLMHNIVPQAAPARRFEIWQCGK